MSTQRSHFAYRLAWENSFSERIPFLPLHRRDLVSAEEGNKTFVGENKSRINWKKFEVMGEVVLGIQRSQKSPHPQAQRFDDLERLILDAKMSGDEEVRLALIYKLLYAWIGLLISLFRTCTLAACISNRPPVARPAEGSSAGSVLRIPSVFSASLEDLFLVSSHPQPPSPVHTSLHLFSPHMPRFTQSSRRYASMIDIYLVVLAFFFPSDFSPSWLDMTLGAAIHLEGSVPIFCT